MLFSHRKELLYDGGIFFLQVRKDSLSLLPSIASGLRTGGLKLKYFYNAAFSLRVSLSRKLTTSLQKLTCLQTYATRLHFLT